MIRQTSLDRSPKVCALSCPACNTGFPLPERELAEGASIHCPHCGRESDLTKEWVEGADTYRWTLIDPEGEFPEEPL